MAAIWYRKAAAQGRPIAMNNLAFLYEHGLGMPQDYAQAVAWYRKAADQGYPRAQANLAILCKQGKGVPQDYVQAYKWLSLAASRSPDKESRDQATSDRDSLAAKMTPGQIAEAQKLAREWKPTK